MEKAQKTPPANAPIRVLLWSPLGAGEHYHGPGSFAYRLYSAAAPGRFAVTLAHGKPDQPEYGLFERHQLICPLRGSALDTWKFVRRGRRFVEQSAGSFDVFHGLTGFHITVSPAHEAQRRGLPAIVFLANHQSELNDKPGLKSLLGLPRRRREMAARLSGLVAMSQAIYDELLGYGIPQRKIARIPMGVNTDRFHPPANAAERSALRTQFGWADRPTLAFVGGVTSRKRPHLLVEAVGLLHKQGRECQVAMIGPDHEPVYTQQMKQRARELGIESSVIWHGFTQDIAPLFRASDFFGLPSANEGMPAALVEAMASGIPSIVTAISGTTDLIVDGKHGRIVEADSQQIADALASYLDHPEQARTQGETARNKVLNQFSTAVVLDAYERLFRRVMAGGDAAE